MKANYLPILLILCFCFILSSCGKGTYFRSFIGAYYLTPSIKLSIYKDDNAIKCEFGFNPEKKVVFCSLFENTEEYDKVCEINHDMNYKRYLYFAPGYPYSIYPDISSIYITSDNDLDSAHPAGTLLNDVFDIIFCSYREFIDQNYSLSSHGKATRYHLKSDKIQPEWLSVIDATHGIYFDFDKKSTKEITTSTHNLTFSFTYTDGTVMSDSIEYTFQ